ncbi:MAG: pilus assembly FimT family protein [Patescibacteria group bacterium]
MKTKNAFTLIELIVAVGIISVFSGMSLAGYLNYTEELKLKSEVGRLISTIELAKKKASSGELFDTGCANFEGYRVEISANSFNLLFLCDGLQQQVQGNLFNSPVSITSVTGNLDFKPLGIGTDITIGTITIRNSRIGKCMNITVNSVGIMSTTDTLISC